ncbi:hypothetical protein [Psychroserpens damuponensis]|uniref:hypothetical protein n=1 Tax=Psychroserpens damuponensis TaxID=943936 RepID=UPI00058F9940|nr:hypothetical protein [Psychroserpens damuponensis]
MNKLDYSISLREKGLSSNEIIENLKAKGFEESEIQYYLKKSDDMYLDQLINNKQSKPKGKLKNDMKIIGLALSLLLLISAFFGYVRIGLLGLFVIWSLVGYSSYRK